MLTHHFAGTIALLPNIIAENNVEYIYYNLAALGMLTEITTIPLNLCWYLNDINQTDNIIYKISAISTLTLYIPFRLIGTPYIYIKLNQHGYNVLATLDIALIFLNYYWFYKLVKRIYQ
jgi:hypothetical protein